MAVHRLYVSVCCDEGSHSLKVVEILSIVGDSLILNPLHSIPPPPNGPFHVVEVTAQGSRIANLLCSLNESFLVDILCFLVMILGLIQILHIAGNEEKLPDSGNVTEIMLTMSMLVEANNIGCKNAHSNLYFASAISDSNSL